MKLLWIFYAVFLAILGYGAATDSAELGYPTPLVLLTLLSYPLLAVGTIIYAFKWRITTVEKYWKLIFGVTVFDSAIGAYMDATMPLDYSLKTDGFVWIRNSLITIVLVIPAFYANYRLAFKTQIQNG